MLGVISLGGQIQGVPGGGIQGWVCQLGCSPSACHFLLAGHLPGCRQLSPGSWQSLILNEIVGFSPALTLNSFLIYYKSQQESF